LSASKNYPDYACAALIVYSIKNKNTVYEDCRIIEINQPYIPGFLAFREVPPLYAMFKHLEKTKPELYPELILLDGNGILHCNYCGLASHLGVLLKITTIGAGKTLFFIDGLTKDRVK
jgi:deoxyinosine 3'endonuclease (endonuclease V)